MDTTDSSQEMPPKPAGTIPPIFSNRFFVIMGEGFVRVSFGESIGPDEPDYHTNIVLPTTSALELSDLLKSLAESIEAARIAQKASADANS